MHLLGLIPQRESEEPVDPVESHHDVRLSPPEGRQPDLCERCLNVPRVPVPEGQVVHEVPS